MKKVIALLLTLIMVISIVGCSNSSSTPKQPDSKSDTASGKIVFLTMAEYHDANVEAVKAYSEAYPNVNVELQEYPFSQLFDVIEVKLGSKSSEFDVILTDTTMVSGYAFRGFIQPIDSAFSAQDKSDLTDAAIKAGTFNGQFYAPPLKNSSQVLYYNKKLLDKAGVKYPSEDPKERMTWEDLVPIAQQVMKASNDPTIFGLTFEQISRPYQILPLSDSLGGAGIGDDAMTVDGYINSDKWVKAMQWYSDIHNKLSIAPKGVKPAETVGLFSAGKLAFFVGNIYNAKAFSGVNGLEFGYAPIPYFKDGKPATPTGSMHLGVSKYSKNAKLAADFVKFMTVGKGNDVFCDKRGELPAKKSKLDAINSDSRYEKFPMTVFKLASYEAKNTAVPRPVTIAYREWEGVIGNTMEDIRNGAPVKESLDKAVQSINAKMQNYK